MFNSVLIVCTGNICRSPIAERLLRRTLPKKKIDSAGIKALVGHSADPSAVLVAQSHNLALDGHEATQFTATLGQQYDLILVMEKFHMEKISHISPEARGKVMYLGHWLDKREIPDPYGKSQEAFEYIYQLIEKASQSWVEKLIE
ncbi:protein tyrosine phosphatase [Rahnella sp. SAP-1]|uniref:protein-tyrosine-phosphatase n=1 Tax=Rouxiella aceris TaxID=2703884 RepID=A0A848ME42_9GAMM|nr:protein tyrosine phosphatase [Rouxiella aceris]NMP25686.1 protein tyrosine phosphatase [Rouxiella aceris]